MCGPRRETFKLHHCLDKEVSACGAFVLGAGLVFSPLRSPTIMGTAGASHTRLWGVLLLPDPHILVSDRT